MSKLMRVLIADDSSVTRRIVTEALNLESDMEIVGAAQNGEEAIAFFKAQKPDVILLDIDMPTMNGIEALKALRAINDSVPVIMFSTLTVRGGEATLDALAAGATDYVAKPSGSGHVDKALSFLRQEVIPKIRLWGSRYKARAEKLGLAPSAGPASPAPAVASGIPRREAIAPRGSASFSVNNTKAAGPIVANGNARRRNLPVSILAIGSSTGGPNALADLLGQLPQDLGIPVVIVQHMPPVFTQLLAERLDRGSRLTVREGFDGAVLRPNEAWIAPGDYHMLVAREGTSTVIRTNKNAAENSCRPAVDVLFRSVADVYGGNALAVVLTGMGRDGTVGCQALSKLGAGILVQDEASSVVWGMPRSVAEAGLAEGILNIRDLAAAISTRIRGSNASLTAASRFD